MFFLGFSYLSLSFLGFSIVFLVFSWLSLFFLVFSVDFLVFSCFLLFFLFFQWFFLVFIGNVLIFVAHALCDRFRIQILQFHDILYSIPQAHNLS